MNAYADAKTEVIESIITADEAAGEDLQISHESTECKTSLVTNPWITVMVRSYYLEN